MTVQRMEIITGVGRRRTWPMALREQIVSETLASETTVTEWRAATMLIAPKCIDGLANSVLWGGSENRASFYRLRFPMEATRRGRLARRRPKWLPPPALF